jgi:hypothetical protein
MAFRAGSVLYYTAAVGQMWAGLQLSLPCLCFGSLFFSFDVTLVVNMSEYRTTKKVVRLDILLFSFISSFIACGVGLLCIAAAQVYPGAHFMVF